MIKHFVTCYECGGDGREIRSKFGGNDPDTWDAGPCQERHCDAGTVPVEDEQGLVGKLLVEHNRKPGSYLPLQFSYKATDTTRTDDKAIGYGISEAAATRDLIEWLEKEKDEADAEAILDRAAA